MVCRDFFADISWAYLNSFGAFGMASTVRMVMMAITISNSISVKPLGCRKRRVRQFEFVRFIRFQFLWVWPKSYAPSVKILQRMDEKGKWSAPSGFFWPVALSCRASLMRAHSSFFCTVEVGRA